MVFAQVGPEIKCPRVPVWVKGGGGVQSLFGQCPNRPCVFLSGASLRWSAYLIFHTQMTCIYLYSYSDYVHISFFILWMMYNLYIFHFSYSEDVHILLFLLFWHWQEKRCGLKCWDRPLSYIWISNFNHLIQMIHRSVPMFRKSNKNASSRIRSARVKPWLGLCLCLCLCICHHHMIDDILLFSIIYHMGGLTWSWDDF